MYIIYILGLLILFALVYVRTASTVGAEWHQDPLSAEPTGKPNEYRLIGDAEPIFNLPANQLMQIVTTYIENQPRTVRIAGEPDENMVTYVQRTLLIRYPDYITIRITSLGENQAKIAFFSRSRFGLSDFGVNKRRVDAWVAAIRGLVAG